MTTGRRSARSARCSPPIPGSSTRSSAWPNRWHAWDATRSGRRLRARAGAVALSRRERSRWRGPASPWKTAASTMPRGRRAARSVSSPAAAHAILARAALARDDLAARRGAGPRWPGSPAPTSEPPSCCPRSTCGATSPSPRSASWRRRGVRSPPARRLATSPSCAATRWPASTGSRKRRPRSKRRYGRFPTTRRPMLAWPHLGHARAYRARRARPARDHARASAGAGDRAARVTHARVHGRCVRRGRLAPACADLALAGQRLRCVLREGSSCSRSTSTEPILMFPDEGPGLVDALATHRIDRCPVAASLARRSLHIAQQPECLCLSTTMGIWAFAMSMSLTMQTRDRLAIFWTVPEGVVFVADAVGRRTGVRIAEHEGRPDQYHCRRRYRHFHVVSSVFPSDRIRRYRPVGSHPSTAGCSLWLMAARVRPSNASVSSTVCKACTEPWDRCPEPRRGT